MTIALHELTLTEADVAAVGECLESGWLTMGPRTQAFEQALAERLGVEHVVTVSSGTSALHLACIAAGLGPGDEAIVPALTSVATANAVRCTGALPVLCDVRGAHDLNLDPDDVERRVGPATRAVVAVHLCGYPAAVAALRELCDRRGLVLIEDAAQALGARTDIDARAAGTVGTLGCFSFGATAQLGVGEGGAVATADEELATRVRLLRSHAMTTVTWDRHRGYAHAYDVVDVGYNYRLDEPRSALGHSRLGRLDDELAARRSLARAYRERLGGLDGLYLPWSPDDVERSAHFSFPVLLRDAPARDAFRESLAAAGIETAAYDALHRLAEYRELMPGLSLPLAEDVSDRRCLLPMSATYGEREADAVARAAADALAAR